MSNYVDITNKWAAETIARLRSSYLEKGLKASGSFGKSLEQKVTEKQNGINVQILAAPHSWFMQYGRKANKDKSVKSAKALYPIILKWIDDKGINVDNKKQFAFRVALKIVYHGITVPNKYNAGDVISSVLTAEWIEELFEQIGTEKLKEVESKYMTSWL